MIYSQFHIDRRVLDGATGYGYFTAIICQTKAQKFCKDFVTALVLFGVIVHCQNGVSKVVGHFSLSISLL